MSVKKGFKIIALILALTFFLLLNNIATAECPDSIGPTETGNPEYSEDCFFFSFDPPLPEELDPGAEIMISFTARNPPPYQWSVDGNGFSLRDTAATGTSNILDVGLNACGTAAITISDDNGTACTGYVRSSEGAWVVKGNHCGLSGSVSYYDISSAGNGLFFDFELISNHQKQYQRSRSSWLDHDACSIVPAICELWNASSCPEDYRNENCIDGDFAGGYPYWCELGTGYPGDYRCFCVYTLIYYEWECPPQP